MRFCRVIVRVLVPPGLKLVGENALTTPILRAVTVTVAVAGRGLTMVVGPVAMVWIGMLFG